MSWLRNERKLWGVRGRGPYVRGGPLSRFFSQETCDLVTVERQKWVVSDIWSPSPTGTKNRLWRVVSALENRQPEVYRSYIELGQLREAL
jgi:hypothetical protein